jgi:hypothetical protein
MAHRGCRGADVAARTRWVGFWVGRFRGGADARESRRRRIVRTQAARCRCTGARVSAQAIHPSRRRVRSAPDLTGPRSLGNSHAAGRACGFVCSRLLSLINAFALGCLGLHHPTAPLRRCAEPDGPPHPRTQSRPLQKRMRGWTRRHGCACVARAFVRTEGFVRLSRVKGTHQRQTNKQAERPLVACLYLLLVVVKARTLGRVRVVPIPECPSPGADVGWGEPQQQA